MKKIIEASFLLIVIFSIAGCGGGGGGDSGASPAIEWVKVDAVSTTATSATLSGTAWVSQSWVAWHCVGIACFYDTSTDNYPGVSVTWTNLTTGVAGSAISYYGGGTNWVHQWQAIAPIVSGKNIIQISAFDPDGRGGSITLNVYSAGAG